MNLREQEYVVKVEECKGISKAAEVLNISQSALSLAIQGIELQIGKPLFIRNRNNFTLTPEGKIYVKYAREILKLHEDYERAMAFYEQQKAGCIRFGTLSRRSCYMTPEILDSYSRLCPNIEVQLVETDMKTLRDMMLEDKLDCIYAYDTIQRSGWNKEKMCSDKIGLAIHKKNPVLQYAVWDEERKYKRIPVSCLKDQRFIIYNNDEMKPVFMKQFVGTGVKPFLMEAYSVETMIRLVEYNYGIYYTNEYYVKKIASENVEFVLMGDQDYEYDLFLSYNEKLMQIEYFAQFIHLIEQNVQ